MDNRTILISGASIAGPALAYWLRRYGFTPTVVERAPALREGGYKIDVRGAASSVLERMGVRADVERLSTEMRGASFVDRRGRRLATMSADFFMARGAGDVEIMRGDLARLLYEKTAGEVEYLWDNTITALEEDGDGVELVFAQGQRRRFDLVIGADGLHSKVRALAFGSEAEFARHLGCYIAIWSIPNYLDLDHWELFYNEPGRMANIYSARDRGAAKALLAFTAPSLAYERHDLRRQKELVATAFAGAEWEVPRVLQYLEAAPDFYFDSISQIRMDGWTRGRTALVGDAAYCPSPASGMGTSMALVGAYVLAGELAAAGGNYRVAWPRYDAALRSYVGRNLDLGVTMAREMVPTSRRQLWVRTQMMRVLPYLPWKGMVTRTIVEPLQQAANGIALADYAASAPRHDVVTA